MALIFNNILRYRFYRQTKPVVSLPSENTFASISQNHSRSDQLALTFPVPKQKRVHSLPDGAVDEGLAGQRLVQLVLQGVAALYLPSAHNVVHEVAL